MEKNKSLQTKLTRQKNKSLFKCNLFVCALMEILISPSGMFFG